MAVHRAARRASTPSRSARSTWPIRRTPTRRPRPTPGRSTAPPDTTPPETHDPDRPARRRRRSWTRPSLLAPRAAPPSSARSTPSRSPSASRRPSTRTSQPGDHTFTACGDRPGRQRRPDARHATRGRSWRRRRRRSTPRRTRRAPARPRRSRSLPTRPASSYFCSLDGLEAHALHVAEDLHRPDRRRAHLRGRPPATTSARSTRRPALHTWTVAVPPETTIGSSSPDGDDHGHERDVQLHAPTTSTRPSSARSTAPPSPSATRRRIYTGLAVGAAHLRRARRPTPRATSTRRPATYSWTVQAPPDTSAPQTTIGAGAPAAQTNSTDATFNFSADEQGSTFAVLARRRRLLHLHVAGQPTRTSLQGGHSSASARPTRPATPTPRPRRTPGRSTPPRRETTIGAERAAGHARRARTPRFSFSSRRAGRDLRVLARRRGVRRLHLAEGVHRPRRRPRTSSASARPTRPATSTARPPRYSWTVEPPPPDCGTGHRERVGQLADSWVDQGSPATNKGSRLDPEGHVQGPEQQRPLPGPVLDADACRPAARSSPPRCACTRARTRRAGRFRPCA